MMSIGYYLYNHFTHTPPVLDAIGSDEAWFIGQIEDPDEILFSFQQLEKITVDRIENVDLMPGIDSGIHSTSNLYNTTLAHTAEGQYLAVVTREHLTAPPKEAFVVKHFPRVKNIFAICFAHQDNRLSCRAAVLKPDNITLETQATFVPGELPAAL